VAFVRETFRVLDAKIRYARQTKNLQVTNNNISLCIGQPTVCGCSGQTKLFYSLLIFQAHPTAGTAIIDQQTVFADPIGRAVYGLSLRPLNYWEYGFESRRRHGCLLCELCIVR
jgi:hypothetical protein